jgi:hypothetical protein
MHREISENWFLNFQKLDVPDRERITTESSVAARQ